MNKSKNTRIVALDYLKAFAIFLVVWGHIVQNCLPSAEFSNDVTTQIIRSFHMPLFMMIVGFFSVSSARKGVKDFIISRFVRLMVPAIIGTFILMLIGLLPGFQRGITAWDTSLWFLKTAFACTILYSICVLPSPTKVITDRQWTTICVVATLAFSQVIAWMSLNTMYPSFLLGAYLKLNFDNIKNRSITLTAVTGIIFACFMVFDSIGIISDIDNPIFNPHGYRAIEWRLARHAYRPCYGLSGAVFFFLLFTAMDKRFSRFKSPLSQRILSIGQSTLGLYVVQTFAIEMLIPFFVPRYIHLDYLTVSLCAPFISLAAIFAMHWIVRKFEGKRIGQFILGV